MQEFLHEYALLLGIDLLLFALVRGVVWIDWNDGHGDVPVSVSLLTALVVVGMHLTAMLVVAGPTWMADRAPVHVTASVVCGLLPVTAALWMVCSSMITGNTHHMHGWNRMIKPNLSNDWGRARSMKRRRDVVGALRQYRRYFNENPVCPRPLFEAELMLEAERCYEEALELLREILRLFGANDLHWVEAVYRMAHVLEIHCHDYETSHYLLRKIIERCPDSDHAVFAARLLADRASATSASGAA
jgi:hypothetical protein